MHRLLVPRGNIEGVHAEVRGESLHYLTRVLRLRQGDGLEVFDGEGRAWEAVVASIGEDLARIELGEALRRSGAPPITLGQGLAKGDKLELVVQKATELGMSRFVPLQLERSVVRLDEAKGADRARRWRKIAEEAARQSGRADVPAVDEPQSLERFLAAAAERGEAVAVLYEGEREKRLGPWIAANLERPIALVVGPEGGFAPAEIERARAAGCAVLGLGPRILRTETAGVAALAVALHLAGELG